MLCPLRFRSAAGVPSLSSIILPVHMLSTYLCLIVLGLK